MFEQRVWRIANVALLLLAALTARILYWQLLRAGELQPLAAPPALSAGADLDSGTLALLQQGSVPANLQNMPQPLIQRLRATLENITRGTIYDRNGRALAYDRLDALGQPQRVYPLPASAPASGYLSGLRLGVTGVERSYNAYLLGLHRVDAQIEQILRAPVRGSDVILTLDAELQGAADAALQRARCHCNSRWARRRGPGDGQRPGF